MDEMKALVEKYANVKPDTDKVTISFDEEVNTFLGFAGKYFRMLVVRASDNTHDYISDKIRNFTDNNGFDFDIMDGKSLTVDAVRGDIDIVYLDGQPYHKRRKPNYWPQPERRKLIVITGIDGQTEIDVLRAFLYVACLGSNREGRDLPEDKLPYGSGYVFLANSDFPFDKFGAISDYAHEEMKVFDATSSSIPQVARNNPSKSNSFLRGLKPDLISKLKKTELWKNHLLNDIRKGDVFPAIRNNEIGFYHGGGLLLRYSKSGFSTHIKYASVLCGDRKNDYITEEDLGKL